MAANESFDQRSELFLALLIASWLSQVAMLWHTTCRHFWLAHMSRLFRFMSMMPLWLVDRAMAKRFNITKPAQPISVKAD